MLASGDQPCRIQRGEKMRKSPLERNEIHGLSLVFVSPLPCEDSPCSSGCMNSAGLKGQGPEEEQGMKRCFSTLPVAAVTWGKEGQDPWHGW